LYLDVDNLDLYVHEGVEYQYQLQMTGLLARVEEVILDKEILG
jgi:hypothetical protein